MKNSMDKSTEELISNIEDCAKQEAITNSWKRSDGFQRELEEFGIDCLKAMKEEIKNSSSNEHERLYAISSAFQRVMSALPRQED